MSEPLRRDPAEEREEIGRHIEEAPIELPISDFKEGLGRIPAGPARGSRGRAHKAKSCELCEGDLWIERDEVVVPCPCRERRATKRAENRLRAGNWVRGISLSFDAPPLSLVPRESRDAVEALCSEVREGRSPSGIWLTGEEESGKSALCAYIAQRLYPTGDVIVERVGDLLAHLRWLGAAKGELAVERRLEALVDVPLLVLDNLDRALRSRRSAAPFSLESGCASHDLIRMAWLLRERQASMKPIVVTSRAAPWNCAERLASVSPHDLVRGLLATAIGVADPFEDFPAYSGGLLQTSFEELERSSIHFSLDASEELAAAA